MTEMKPPSIRTYGTYDLLGVGFGPANLAVAIARKEHNSRVSGADRLTVKFLERNERFQWHPGTLFDDAVMQISFLKDLATPRNPTSAFGFVAYLHDQGRLDSFVNQQSVFPGRVEFHNYLEWVAGSFEEDVSYGATVVKIEDAEPDQDACFVLKVQLNGGRLKAPVMLKARNIVLSLGSEPQMPDGVDVADRIWHSSELLPRLAGISAEELQSVVVIGAGQSAAESVAHVHQRYATATVHAVFERYSYRAMEDSPYANTIFDPATVDALWSMQDEMRDRVLQDYRNTNYAAVDSDLIFELYRRSYRESVRGKPRLMLHSLSEVIEVKEGSERVRLLLRSLMSGQRWSVYADVVVFATGYKAVDPVELIGDLRSTCRFDQKGRLTIGRNHQMLQHHSGTGAIYVQGAVTEHTHGISASLLSVAAIRAGEIVESLSAENGRSSRGPESMPKPALASEVVDAPPR